MSENRVHIKKSDSALQIVWTEAYIPLFPDSDMDIMLPDTVRNMAYNFMKSEKNNKIDIYHNNQCIYGCSVVESFIAREGDPDFIEGAWVVGVHIPGEREWEMVEKGEINGFSIEARAKTRPCLIEIELPDDGTLKGQTQDNDGHFHDFEVSFDTKGNFLGGRTTEVNGHSHIIKSGTITKPAKGHTHRYSFMDVWAKLGGNNES